VTRAPSRVGAGVVQKSLAPEAEHRQLTELFCDLVDSTRLAAGMDAEDWRELLQAYQTAGASAAERFGGHVAQFLGDGLLVYFGWPRAHEDDAERAVRAGLDIVQAVGALRPDLAVRIGVHTGPVVVGEIGAGSRREMLALGKTTNVAARLEKAAPANAVVVSGTTLRLVQGVFRIEDLGERLLKGIDAPVRVIRALAPTGVRSRLDVASASELTPLVGRDQERNLLKVCWQQATGGRGQVVLIAGEAGIGKSRLVQAFREQLTEQPHTWLECRASHYSQDSALFTVLELARLGLEIRPGDTAEERLAKLERGLEISGLVLAEAVPSLAAFLSIPLPPDRYTLPNLSPEGLRKKTLALLVEWLKRLGRLQPLVLVAEDLHWLDPSSIEFLGSVLDQVATEPILILLTCRPDFEPPWGARSHLTPVPLSRLTRPQVVELVHGAARARELAERSVAEIALRSDGVPLFAEELTRAVIEGSTGAGETSTRHIPETLQDSLMARIDALGPVKELAQLASVLGREFDCELLLAVSPVSASELESSLAVAVREELFYRRGTPPEATYLFKHALIRDAAYASMLRATRQRHHHRVAETLIARMPEVAQTQPERVAHHLGEAGEADSAIEWWIRAGERAASRADYAEAVVAMRRGLDLVPKLRDAGARRETELRLWRTRATAARAIATNTQW
jgi:class 3 adenylate cyclase